MYSPRHIRDMGELYQGPQHQMTLHKAVSDLKVWCDHSCLQYHFSVQTNAPSHTYSSHNPRRMELLHVDSLFATKHTWTLKSEQHCPWPPHTCLSHCRWATAARKQLYSQESPMTVYSQALPTPKIKSKYTNYLKLNLYGRMFETMPSFKKIDKINASSRFLQRLGSFSMQVFLSALTPSHCIITNEGWCAKYLR